MVIHAIMTAIPAKVVAVDRQSDQYRVIVRIGLAKYRGSFNTLKFGEKKRSPASVATVNLNLFTSKIPVSKPESRSRCGQFSKRIWLTAWPFLLLSASSLLADRFP